MVKITRTLCLGPSWPQADQTTCKAMGISMDALLMPQHGCCMMQVFEIMTARGFAPTATTYTALISAHAKAERLDLALATFHRMVCA